MAEEKKKGKGKGEEKETKPELVELKLVAKQAGLEPRAARVLLRKMGVRGEDAKRARWAWAPSEVPGVVAKLKKAAAEKAVAKEKAAAEKEEEE